MNQQLPPPIPSLRAGERAVHRRAARLAQRLLRRPVSLDRQRRHAAVGRAELRRCCPACRAPKPAEDDGDAPWHDQTMPLAERMKLAEGRPLRRRMMAAMAQQDCGQCGYNCEDYAECAVRQEGRAAEPLRAGRQGNRPHAEGAVSSEIGTAPARRRRRPQPPCSRRPQPDAPLGRSRDNPVDATFVSRARLNKPGSEKETWHIEFDLTRMRARLRRRRRLRPVSDQRSGAGRRGARGARRAGRFPDRRPHACARC